MQVSGLKSAAIGIISHLTDIWITANTVMVAGSSLMVSGILLIQTDSGRLIVPAGGLRMAAGMRLVSGFGLMVPAIILMIRDIWNTIVIGTAAGSQLVVRGIHRPVPVNGLVIPPDGGTRIMAGILRIRDSG